MGERFGSDETAGDTTFTDGGDITDPAEERFGGEGDGGVQWSAETFFLNSLSDVEIPTPPTDGWVLTYDTLSGKWIASAPTGGGSDVAFEPETISIDIDFAGVASVDVQIPLTDEVRILLMGRLYIDADPGAAFNQWATYTFYDKSTKKGGDAYYRSVVKMAYTELEAGTTGINAEFTPDDHTVFGECNLVKFLDDGEYARVEVASVQTVSLKMDLILVK